MRAEETRAIRCPAAIVQHPVLSSNETDVQCQVAGRLQPAEGSPCTGDYVNCAIWKRAKQIEWLNKERVLDANRTMDAHVLREGGVRRDSVRADGR